MTALTKCLTSFMIAISGAVAFAPGGSSDVTLGTHDLLLRGGASFVGGHGAPTGVSIRTGNPGQSTTAAFGLALTPGSTLTGLTTSFRYVTGYGPTGVGPNVSLTVVEDGQEDQPMQVIATRPREPRHSINPWVAPQGQAPQ